MDKWIIESILLVSQVLDKSKSISRNNDVLSDDDLSDNDNIVAPAKATSKRGKYG